MNSVELTGELRRFIYSIASIPHLEAMLLMHQTPGQVWESAAIAQQLYLNSDQATGMLIDLSQAGVCRALPAEAAKYIYSPATEEIGELVNQLAHYYSRNLIEVTNMIHSKAPVAQRVHLFADAFKFNKDK